MSANGGPHPHQYSNGHSKRLASWRWWEDPETVAWGQRLVAWIEDQRVCTHQFRCTACGSDVPFDTLIARRRSA